MTPRANRKPRARREAKQIESRVGVSPASASTWKVRWTAIALATVVCLAYAPALRAPFIFDDATSIVDNTSIRRLWPLTVPLDPPGGGRAVSGRPVVNLSLAVDYAVNALLGIDQRAEANDSAQVISYRLTNLLLHLLCGALLFGVIRRTLRSPRLAENWAAAGNRIAGLTTAIWLLHPIQSEAVNYVIQRTELLVSACWLTTMYAWIRVWDATNPRRAELSGAPRPSSPACSGWEAKRS